MATWQTARSVYYSSNCLIYFRISSTLKPPRLQGGLHARESRHEAITGLVKAVQLGREHLYDTDEQLLRWDLSLLRENVLRASGGLGPSWRSRRLRVHGGGLVVTL